MAVVAQPDMVRPSSSPAGLIGITAPGALPVTARIRFARRRRIVEALRAVAGVAAVAGAAMALLAFTFFSLVGR